VQAECSKFSGDVKFFAEYQTGIKWFYPWLCNAETKVNAGLPIPDNLLAACNSLGDSKTFQDDCEKNLVKLNEAGECAGKMTYHQHADTAVIGYRSRWEAVHGVSKNWVERLTNLVECWDRLDGRVGELSSWVNLSSSQLPEGKDELSIEKLEDQLDTLKANFKEKESLVLDIKVACGGKQSSLYPTGETAQRGSTAQESKQRLTSISVAPEASLPAAEAANGAAPPSKQAAAPTTEQAAPAAAVALAGV